MERMFINFLNDARMSFVTLNSKCEAGRQVFHGRDFNNVPVRACVRVCVRACVRVSFLKISDVSV